MYAAACRQRSTQGGRHHSNRQVGRQTQGGAGIEEFTLRDVEQTDRERDRHGDRHTGSCIRAEKHSRR